MQRSTDKMLTLDGYTDFTAEFERLLTEDNKLPKTFSFKIGEYIEIKKDGESIDCSFTIGDTSGKFKLDLLPEIMETVKVTLDDLNCSINYLLSLIPLPNVAQYQDYVDKINRLKMRASCFVELEDSYNSYAPKGLSIKIGEHITLKEKDGRFVFVSNRSASEEEIIKNNPSRA